MSDIKENILVFEAVGVKSSTGVSCRVRTRLQDKIGKVVYLELHGMERGRYLIDAMLSTPFECIGAVMSAHYVQDDGSEDSHIKRPVNDYFDYTEQGILQYVNNLLGTTYKQVSFSDSVRVFNTQSCLCKENVTCTA